MKMKISRNEWKTRAILYLGGRKVWIDEKPVKMNTLCFIARNLKKINEKMNIIDVYISNCDKQDGFFHFDSSSI